MRRRSPKTSNPGRTETFRLSNSTRPLNRALRVSTTRPRRMGPARWIIRASSPLPVPVSPWMRIGGSRRESAGRSSRRATFSRTARMPGLSPSSSLNAFIPGILPRAGRSGVQVLTTSGLVDRLITLQVFDFYDVSFGTSCA